MKDNVFQGITIQDGVAAISGVSVETLAQECGTPLYIYDEPALVAQMKAYTQSFQSADFQTRIVYATKAFNCKAMLRLCEANGLYCDSVSLGEIYTAKKAGINMERIYFHGNNKTRNELEKAFEYGVGTIICDSIEEAKRVCEVAKEYPFTTMRTLLRVNPQVDAHTHKYIQTATPDSKFGMPIVKVEDIDNAAKMLSETFNIVFAGFHAHIGSQLFETDPFLKEINELTTFIEAFEARTNLKVNELDLGGGFGVWYTEADTPLPVQQVCQTLIQACQEAFKAHNLQIEIVSIEPGRSMVAEAGYLLYTVTLIKQSLKDKFLFVDGGMSDLIRPALYEAKYSADLAQKMDQPKSEVVTVAGKCCESGDIVIRDIALPVAEENDLLLIYSAGAYGYSMASNYNKLPMPGVVFVDNGKWRWVIRPQSLDDLIAREENE